MEYTYGKYGKPYLPEAGLFFNLSHSGEYVMAAVSEYETGCDIEKISHSYEAVARRFFQKHEYEQLQSLQGTERDELFYRFWVLKESYMKVTGKGICLGPETFGFDLLHGQIIFNGPGEGDEYSFREYSGPQGYRSAVCIHGTAEIADMIETDLKVLLV
jgi:4'-phosphopantetheinyl transferase